MKPEELDAQIEKEISELEGIQKAKLIKSDTRVKAVHVKINNINYHVSCAPIPRLYTETCGYTATRTGKVENFNTPLFRFRGDDLVEGVRELIATLNGTSERGDTSKAVPPIVKI